MKTSVLNLGRYEHFEPVIYFSFVGSLLQRNSATAGLYLTNHWLFVLAFWVSSKHDSSLEKGLSGQDNLPEQTGSSANVGIIRY